jgi:PTH1 family peptidyl-tRNA hydrolase
LKIVLGLGNPGAAYRSTRHNVGFWVLDHLARRAGVEFRVAGLFRRHAWIAEIGSAGTVLALAKPRTFMNRSGRAGEALLRRYRALPEELLVVHDDADLELGRLRLRPGGGDGGHNGVRSLIEALGSGGFPRLRLGVRGEGRDDRDLAGYVLDSFPRDEFPIARELSELAADAVRVVCADGLEAAMNRYNGRRVRRDAGPEAN